MTYLPGPTPPSCPRRLLRRRVWPRRLREDMNGVNSSDDDDSDSDTRNEAEAWDAAVLKASKMFETRLHCMVCGNDCHSHVAVALNLMGYGGFSWWNKVILAAWIFFGGRHTTWGSVVATWIGPALVAMIVLVSYLT